MGYCLVNTHTEKPWTQIVWSSYFNWNELGDFNNNSGSISNYISKGSKILSIVLGSILMLVIDFFIEPVAPMLDFWEI